MEEFFGFVSLNGMLDISKDLIVEYGRIRRENKNKDINEEAAAVKLLSNKIQLSNSHLLVLVDKYLKQGHDLVIKFLKNHIPGESFDDTMARVEDILLEERKKKEEDEKEEERVRLREAKIKAVED